MTVHIYFPACNLKNSHSSEFTLSVSCSLTMSILGLFHVIFFSFFFFSVNYTVALTIISYICGTYYYYYYILFS